MLDAPIPADDELRLADLCALDLLDSAPEARFDRITQAAQRLFGVPIALVSLVDRNRQWFKSRAGLDATETPRNISFCGHAIHNDHALVIPDAMADARFADNPLVTGELQLRFYAGMPLKSRNGRALGTLCLIDRRPRTLCGDELKLLADLGAWAERELNLRELEEANAVAESAGRRLQVVLDGTADAIIAVDEQLAIHTFNRAAEQMFGRKAARIVGQSLRALLPAVAIERLNEAIGTLLVHHQLHLALPPELRLLSADGTPFHADIRLGRTEIGARACFTLIIRDVTEQRELEAMKSEFVATVSHELRTPVTSITGAVKLLLSMKAALSPPQLRLLDIADKNCERLAHMVNDILDLEKLDSGQLAMNRKMQSLGPWLRNALVTMQPFADTFGVQIGCRAIDDAQALCCFDEGRMTQVLVNLLSNAIKFSPPGGRVDVRLERIGSQLRISVADRGRGIPEEFRSRIFQRFAQAGPNSVRGQAGTGLGLAICKAIVEQHDGQIGFDSMVGCGSTFHVDLPRADVAAHQR